MCVYYLFVSVWSWIHVICFLTDCHIKFSVVPGAFEDELVFLVFAGKPPQITKAAAGEGDEDGETLNADWLVRNCEWKEIVFLKKQIESQSNEKYWRRHGCAEFSLSSQCYVLKSNVVEEEAKLKCLLWERTWGKFKTKTQTSAVDQMSRILSGQLYFFDPSIHPPTQ